MMAGLLFRLLLRPPLANGDRRPPEFNVCTLSRIRAIGSAAATRLAKNTPQDAVPQKPAALISRRTARCLFSSAKRWEKIARTSIFRSPFINSVSTSMERCSERMPISSA